MKVLKFFIYALLIFGCLIGGIVACSGSDYDDGKAESANSQQQNIVVKKSTEVDEYAGMSICQKNAVKSAKDYLAYTAFSDTGLIKQLEYEQYSTEDATYAADHCGADWNEQALISAKNYLDYTAFSYTGLVNQLEFEGFTTDQSTYGVDHCGADWNEQAALCAKNYLDYSSFSRGELIDQLEFEGFTQEQAEYGVTKVGY